MARSSETRLLEHANRSEIVFGDASAERPRRLNAKELGQSSRGDASAPILSTYPIAYEPFVGGCIRPCADVSGNVRAPENGVTRGSGIAEDLGRPMGEERLPIPRWEGGELGGQGIELVVKEDQEIVSPNTTEGHAIFHFERG